MNQESLSNNEKLRFFTPEDTRYVHFQHEQNPPQIHYFFNLGDREYKFVLSVHRDGDEPEKIIRQFYTLNSAYSIPEYCVEPYRFQSETCSGWACEYGLMKGKGLRLCMVIFDTPFRYLSLTFSAEPEGYADGRQMFDKILHSFRLEDNKPETVKD